MISANEFILFYNELFKYIDITLGKKEVERLWEGIKDSYCKKLEDLVMKKGLKGMYLFWSNTTSKEGGRCVLTLRDDEFILDWHSCPSIGKLRNTHVTPYKDYCGHCPALYNPILEKYGFEATRYIIDRERGECRLHVKKKYI